LAQETAAQMGPMLLLHRLAKAVDRLLNVLTDVHGAIYRNLMIAAHFMKCGRERSFDHHSPPFEALGRRPRFGGWLSRNANATVFSLKIAHE
jgi:hypothetical protein